MNTAPLLCSAEGDTLCLSTRATDVALTHSPVFPSFPVLSDVAHSVPGSTLHAGSIMWRPVSSICPWAPLNAGSATWRKCPSLSLAPHDTWGLKWGEMIPILFLACHTCRVCHIKRVSLLCPCRLPHYMLGLLWEKIMLSSLSCPPTLHTRYSY